MRLRNIKNKAEILNNSNVILDGTSYKGHWQKEFNNNNPINIEIGMGRGNFIVEMAKAFPNINFIGIEKFDSLLVTAYEKTIEKPLTNLRLLRLDAFFINDVFDQEIDLIYLNFSDPWPKKRHNKRRLTSTIFLSKYEKIFKDKKSIHLKTDNKDLFEYSKITLENYGFKLKNIVDDLEKSNIFNIKTEYEEKFIKNGNKINRLEAYKL